MTCALHGGDLCVSSRIRHQRTGRACVGGAPADNWGPGRLRAALTPITAATRQFRSHLAARGRSETGRPFRRPRCAGDSGADGQLCGSPALRGRFACPRRRLETLWKARRKFAVSETAPLEQAVRGPLVKRQRCPHAALPESIQDALSHNARNAVVRLGMLLCLLRLRRCGAHPLILWRECEISAPHTAPSAAEKES